MKFSKWQGCGNDFVLINCLQDKVADYAAFAQEVCDRHYGVGADGILVVEPSVKADFRMRIFNTDGSEAEMCGNGIRCFARYLYDSHLTDKKEFTVETGAGVLVPRLIFEGGYRIRRARRYGRAHSRGRRDPGQGLWPPSRRQ